jgi:hypothetical protein
MCHDAGAGSPERGTDCAQYVALDRHAGAMLAAIDLDQGP